MEAAEYIAKFKLIRILTMRRDMLYERWVTKQQMIEFMTWWREREQQRNAGEGTGKTLQ